MSLENHQNKFLHDAMIIKRETFKRKCLSCHTNFIRNLLAEATNEHPFFEAMSSANSEEPMFSSFIDEKFNKSSKVFEPVIHLLKIKLIRTLFLDHLKHHW